MPTVPHGPLEGAEYHHWSTSREADDTGTMPGKPLLRASIGGRGDIGFYFTFRGEPEAIAHMLEQAAQLARAVADGKATYKDKR